MQQNPAAAALIEAVIEYLVHEILPDAHPAQVYQLRVVVNALRLCRREVEMLPSVRAEERARVEALLACDGEGDLDALNERLARAIGSRTLGFETPGLVDHLWTTALARLAIDQPDYGGYAARAASAAFPER